MSEEYRSVSISKDKSREEKPSTNFNYILLKMTILFTAPILFPVLLLQFLYYALRMGIIEAGMISVVTGAVSILFTEHYRVKTGEYLHGREMLITTFYDKPGVYWSDFALLKLNGVRPVGIVTEKGKKEVGEELELLQKLPSGAFIEYELDFEDFAAFDRAVVLLPATYKRMFVFTPQQVFFRGLLVMGSATPCVMVKLRELEIMGERIPVVKVIASDYHAEVEQKRMKLYDVTPEMVEVAIEKYDSWRSVTATQIAISRDREIQSLLKHRDDIDERAAVKAGSAIEDFLDTEQEAHEGYNIKEKVFSSKWFKLAIIVGIILTFFFAASLIRV